jgi:hypothetical protein
MHTLQTTYLGMYDRIQKGSTDPVQWKEDPGIKGKDPPGINLKVRGIEKGLYHFTTTLDCHIKLPQKKSIKI